MEPQGGSCAGPGAGLKCNAAGGRRRSPWSAQGAWARKRGVAGFCGLGLQGPTLAMRRMSITSGASGSKRGSSLRRRPPAGEGGRGAEGQPPSPESAEVAREAHSRVGRYLRILAMVTALWRRDGSGGEDYGTAGGG